MHYVNSAPIFCKFVPKILSMIVALNPCPDKYI